MQTSRSVGKKKAARSLSKNSRNRKTKTSIDARAGGSKGRKENQTSRKPNTILIGAATPKDFLRKPPLNNAMQTIQPALRTLEKEFNGPGSSQAALMRRTNNLKTISASVQKPAKKSASLSKTRKPERLEISDIAEKGENASDTLAQKLLMDIAKKYRHIEKNLQNPKCHYQGHGSGVAAQSQQKKQMLQDIQSLANALIKNEKKTIKFKQENKASQKNMRQIIKDQEYCIQMMQDKIERLEKTNDKQERVGSRIEHRLSKEREVFKTGQEALEKEVSEVQQRR